MPLLDEHSYCNELHEIKPFPDEETARNWLNDNKLTNDGITLLVPFKRNGKIRFLKPDENNSCNEHLRFIGMANKTQKPLLQNITDLLNSYPVPRLTNIEGDNIIPDTHGVLIVYEQGEHSVGKYFHEVFKKVTEELIEKSKRSSSNDPTLQINLGELMENLSILSVSQSEDNKFDIESGRMYFVRGNRLFRYTFKKDEGNNTEDKYLAAEVETKMRVDIEVDTEKTINHHRVGKVLGYLKVFILGFAVGASTAGLAFLCLSLAHVPFLAPIGATAIGVAAMLLVIKKGIDHVNQANVDTVEYGAVSFKKLSVSILTEIKNDLKALFTCGKQHDNPAGVAEVVQVARTVAPIVVAQCVQEQHSPKPAHGAGGPRSFTLLNKSNKKIPASDSTTAENLPPTVRLGM